jgi:type IV pilus assembly protein PilY1
MKHTKRSFGGFLVATALLLAGARASADDIDLFVRSSPTSSVPDVLFVIDNASAFSSSSTVRCTIGLGRMDRTVGGIEQCALHEVITALDPGTVRIGVMVYNGSSVVDWEGNDCPRFDSSRPGGCLVYPMTLMDADGKADLLGWIEEWKTSATGPGKRINASSQATGGVMQEAFAYLKGRTGLSGRDYAGDAPTGACNTFIIFLGNSFSSSGSPGDQTGAKGPRDALNGTNPAAAKNALPGATPEQKAIISKSFSTSCGTATLGSVNHENKGYFADEWARYLNTTHSVSTYTIGLLGPSCQADYASTLTSMAEVGGGKYFPTRDKSELVIAIKTALSEMLSVNSVFASVSLPVTVNTEGYYLNQVFIGMFRPDKDTLPRWVGNLKQYRLGKVGEELKLLDAKATPEAAISSAGTGFLAACAQSYWTPTTGDTYWTNILQRNCETADSRSNTPDGPVVEKGGQGFTLRGTAPASRNLKTCSDSGCTGIDDFDDGNAAITKTLLGNASMSSEERTVIIDWARGLNNRGSTAAKVVYPTEEGDETFVAATAMRPSVHGDVVHSRPVAINFSDDEDDPEVVVFYGANDGVLRAVNGNRADDIDGIAAGREMWGFVPPEFFGHFKRLRDNKPNIKVKGTEAETDRRAKPYGFDGPVESYVDFAGDTYWVFASMRRGGRMVYAFDVSDINTDPDSPDLLWRIGCPNLTDDTGCTSTGLEGIGQTWSAPQVMKTRGYAAVADDPGTPTVDEFVAQPMIIMGGGYDTCEDVDTTGTAPCTTSAKGRYVYVLDAEDGSVLKTFTADRPVAADIIVVPDGTTGRAKWAYAVDMGGNVYRISGASANAPFGSTAPGSWNMTKIASLGCDTASTCTPNRKFMYAPDVVLDELPSGYVLLVGSGDREKPLEDYTAAQTVDNHFFMIRDFPEDATWLSGETTTCGSALICLNSLLEIGTTAATPTDAALAAKKGWYLEMREGEKVVTSAVTVFGAVTFSTHTPTDPPDGACTSDLGTARVYNLRYANAAPAKLGVTERSEEVDGGGLPPSPVAGLVKLDDGSVVPFIIGADGTSPLEGGEPVSPALTTLPKSITYWYIEK